MIRSIIIEDEKVSRDVLKRIIEKNFDDVGVIAEADNVKEAIVLIRQLKPDLVFLDIELEDGSGFKVLESFVDINFQVVFVTAHNQFAINAIKWSALDYILKPVIPEDLINVIKKFRKSQTGIENSIKHQAFLENIKDESTESKKIVISTSNEHYMVSPSNIVRCQSDNYYTIIYFDNGEKVMVSKTLKEYESLLQDCGFLRVHNSHLVNISHIKRFAKPDGGYVEMDDNSEVPVSRRKKALVLEAILNRSAK
jgi:two-component system LytT family response regulator